ncbi:hypothetical protein CF70_011710 [Cupriavidus sp. SK-3]|mgnify:CR=1 FL=1|nr:hypothetical protein CF70_011710 [Cupriavidus sp. SK-3]
MLGTQRPADARAEALTDEQIIALADRGEYLTPSPGKYPELVHGTQYHCAVPGLLQLARAQSAASLLRLPRRAERLVPVLVNSTIPLFGLPRRAAVALATAVAIVVRHHGAAAKQSATGDQQHKNGFHGSFFWGTIADSISVTTPLTCKKQ